MPSLRDIEEGDVVRIVCDGDIQNPWDKHKGEHFVGELLEKNVFEDSDIRDSHLVKKIDGIDWPKNGDGVDEKLFAHAEYVEPIGISCKHGDIIWHDGREEWVCPWCDI